MIRSTAYIALLWCCATHAQWLSVAPLAEDITHRPSGNGALTAAVLSDGSLGAFRWPSPCSPNQLIVDANGNGGAYWGLEREGEITWLTSGNWNPEQRYSAPSNPIVVTEGVTGDGVHVSQLFCVLPEDHVALSRIRLESEESTANFVWYGAFSPQNEALRGWPFLPEGTSANHGFAAFYDSSTDTVYHFRPAELGLADWEHVSKLSAEELSRDASRVFDAGLWIGYTAVEGVDRAACGTLGNGGSAADTLMDEPAALSSGNTDSAIAAGGTDAREATVLIAAGRTRQEVDALLDKYKASSPAALIQQTEEAWAKRIHSLSVPPRIDALIPVATRSLVTIAIMTGRESGAIARSVLSGIEARDIPRFSLWPARAWRIAGNPEQSRAHTLFVAKQVILQPGPSTPYGLAPAAIAASGAAAAPPYAVDIDSVSAFLTEASEMAVLSEESFLEEIWPAYDAAADLLARWAVPNSTTPLPGFEPRVKRDLAMPSRYVHYYRAMEHAAALALHQNIERAEWLRRRTELETLVQRNLLDAHSMWKLDPALYPAGTGLIGPNSPDLQGYAEALIPQLDVLSGPALLNALLVLAETGAIQYLDDSHAQSLAILDRSSNYIERDAVSATLAYLAIRTISAMDALQ